jgi:hypothetical protein
VDEGTEGRDDEVANNTVKRGMGMKSDNLLRNVGNYLQDYP